MFYPIILIHFTSFYHHFTLFWRLFGGSSDVHLADPISAPLHHFHAPLAAPAAVPAAPAAPAAAPAMPAPTLQGPAAALMRKTWQTRENRDVNGI